MGIYSYLKSPNDDQPYKTDWKEPTYLNGIIEDGEFGKGVAISSNGRTVAVGSPGANMVQVFSLFKRDGESSWPQKGDDIKPTGSTDIKFGYRVGLSDDGMSLAVAAPYSKHPKTMVLEVGAIFVYDWDVTNDDWIIGMAVAYGTNKHDRLGSRGVAFHLSPLASLHAITSTNARRSFKVRQFCFNIYLSIN